LSEECTPARRRLGLGYLFVVFGVLQSTVCTVLGKALACLGGVTTIGGNALEDPLLAGVPSSLVSV